MAPPRISPVTDPTPEQAEELGKGILVGGKPLNIFGTLAHHPRLLRRFVVLGGAFLNGGKLPEREREVVILRVGWRCWSDYEFGQHTIIGERAGLSADEIAALANARDHDWPADDRALIALADELCEHDTVSESTWSALASRWDDAEMLELVLLAGYYRMVSGFLNAVGVERDAGVPGFPVDARPPGG